MGIQNHISEFGAAVKAKLAAAGATGEPEDQLRAPTEKLLADVAALCGFAKGDVTAVGESTVAALRTRPDYAVTVRDALTGFVEIKAPGKGADPRRFRDSHDKAQWGRLQSLPNLLYTDGNEFGLCRNGEVVNLVRLIGDVATSGAALGAPEGLVGLFENFLRWEPIPPRDAKSLAQVTARLCRLLRAEAAEIIEAGDANLRALEELWRKQLLPDIRGDEFPDAYAQAVTFGLLMARARGIRLASGLERAARELRKTNSLIGSALRLLTETADGGEVEAPSLRTMVRVLDVVDWPTVSKGRDDAWLYFYEDFLEVYDNRLRKQTGSYYTPPEVVAAMAGLVDSALRTRFKRYDGLASPEVTVADPAMGTGTFLLGVLRRIAATAAADQGAGAVPAVIEAALKRLYAFELQLGPFAVAQLRVLAEVVALTGEPPKERPRMFVADTLDDPNVEAENLPGAFSAISDSRKQANRIKKTERITVVIGNPPYKEKANGRGGWVESGSDSYAALLDDWQPPREWGVGAHAKHLRNLYVYFWRWAAWKVFDQRRDDNRGIVCFITVAGFLNGPGFQRMRDDLRRKADEIWVIDCSPEGHQPEVNTRIFQGVQQPVCIVMASRSPEAGREPGAAARVRFRALPAGRREDKFAALAAVSLDDGGWADCPRDGRAPFLPASAGAWASMPPLDAFFLYNGSGVMPGRTWIIAPDSESLRLRWKALVDAPADRKEDLFHPHLNGDRAVGRIVAKGLPGHDSRTKAVADDSGPCVDPVRYGFRSFDRQWIIPDNRLINRPNPTLWDWHSKKQVYLTALVRTSPSSGPAITFTGLVPDLDHYKGSFGGRVFPLWADRDGKEPNVAPALTAFLSARYGRAVTAEDVMAYVAAAAAHPAYTARFAEDLRQPGLRIPLTADAGLFAEAADLGRTVIWLHTFGERCADPRRGRPPGPPRVPGGTGPRIPADGAIPSVPEAMPDEMTYDPALQRLTVGSGHIDGVPPRVWEYEVSGKPVLRQWFSYRKRNRERPLIGDRRPPSKLGDIQPPGWPAEYTTELIDVLHVLCRLADLEPSQAALLERLCSAPLITLEELRAAGALAPEGRPRIAGDRGPDDQLSLLPD